MTDIIRQNSQEAGGQYVRIIFERGLQLLNSEAGWLIPSSKSHHVVESPQALESRFSVKTITVYRDVAPFLYPRTVLDKAGNRLSSARHLAGYVEDDARRIYKYQVEHFLFTAITHLAYLAEAYAGLAVLKNHDEWQIGEDTVVTSSRHLYNAALLHSESVFAALHSALHAARHLVWRWRGRVADSIEGVFRLCAEEGDGRLDAILAPLEDCVTVWGTTIEAYRDCTAHYHSQADLGGRSGGELLFDDIWEILIDLPDNPNAHPSEYTFANDVDALDLAWDATTAVTRALEGTLPRVFHWSQAALPEARRWI